MLKNQKNDYCVNLQNFTKLITLVLFCLFVQYIFYFLSKSKTYSFFIEFNSVNSVQVGTPIRMRGIDIGSVQAIRLKPDCILVMAKIDSNKVLIPVFSTIETTQTGLLNDPVINVIPLDFLLFQSDHRYNPLSIACDSSTIICDKMYVAGDRGLNYDDLIRSTTRISQRFDDPRFFNIFYLFLQNSIELTDYFIKLISYIQQ